MKRSRQNGVAHFHQVKTVVARVVKEEIEPAAATFIPAIPELGMEKMRNGFQETVFTCENQLNESALRVK